MTLAGFDQSQRRAAAVVALETAIAQTHGSGEALASDSNLSNKWLADDFAAKAPGIDWRAFFAAARLSSVKQIVVWQPRAIAGGASLVASEPLETWKDYLRFHVIEHYADVLPKLIAERAREFHGVRLGDARWIAPRAQRALDSANVSLLDAIGKMYVENYSPQAQRAKVREIASNVIHAFGRRIKAAPWLTPPAKLMAMEKLHTLYFGVGYPEHWIDYSGLKIDPADALANFRRVEAWNYQQALSRLAKPADFTEWHLAAHTVGASSFPFQNAYNFCAGLLQPPKFDPQASDAANYGAIGAIIGHEVSHFFDDSGASYDSLGRPLKWWSSTDAKQFEAATAPLAEQYSGYRPLPDLPIDGKLTLSESVADLGGLVAAFDAYRSTLGS